MIPTELHLLSSWVILVGAPRPESIRLSTSIPSAREARWLEERCSCVGLAGTAISRRLRRSRSRTPCCSSRSRQQPDTVESRAPLSWRPTVASTLPLSGHVHDSSGNPALPLWRVEAPREGIFCRVLPCYSPEIPVTYERSTYESLTLHHFFFLRESWRKRLVRALERGAGDTG